MFIIDPELQYFDRNSITFPIFSHTIRSQIPSTSIFTSIKNPQRTYTPQGGAFTSPLSARVLLRRKSPPSQDRSFAITLQSEHTHAIEYLAHTTGGRGGCARGIAGIATVSPLKRRRKLSSIAVYVRKHCRIAVWDCVGKILYRRL